MGKRIASRAVGAGVGVARAQRANRMLRAQRREQLLRAATDIVRSEGITALTMAALAQRAGVSKPVVYEHFSNSEDVSLALVQEYFSSIVNFVQNKTSDAESLDEYIAIVIDVEFDFHANGALSLREITNGHTSSHATGDRLNRAFRKIKEQATGTFRDLLMQQGVPQSAASIAGYILAEMLSNTVPEFAGGADDARSREILKSMMVASLRAICPEVKVRPTTPGWILAEAARSAESPDDS